MQPEMSSGYLMYMELLSAYHLLDKRLKLQLPQEI